MAFVPRLQLSRVLGLALRSRGAVVRPTTPSLATRLRCLSVASYPTWNASCRVENKSVSKWTVRPLPLLLSRGFAAEGLTVEELKERTVNVLKLFDKVNPEKVTLEAHFMNDLGMDSLDTVEVVMAFEDEFGVEISDEEAEKVFTCSDAVELLKTKLDIH